MSTTFEKNVQGCYDFSPIGKFLNQKSTERHSAAIEGRRVIWKFTKR